MYNKIGKRLISLLLVLLLAVCLMCPGALAADDTEEMVARAKQGVVQLYSLGYYDGQLVACKGTGFAVGTAGEDSNVFVTNWHVVTGEGRFDPKQAKVYIALDNATFEDAYYETDRVISCKVAYITNGNPDMAILRAAEPVYGYKALPLMSSDEVMDAAHVVALGYPGVLDDATSTNGGLDDMSTTQGYIVRHAVGQDSDPAIAGTKLLFFDAVITGGNSGGPLVNDDGAVVGINTYGFGQAAATDYSGAIYIDYAMQALDGLGIPYDVYHEGAAGRLGGLSPLVIALIALGAVIIIAAVVILLRRPSKEPAVVGAGAAVSAGAGGGWLPNGPASGFTLLGPGGLSTPVTASGLVIGRDPAQCTLCLPAGTNGVSRRHCQVTLSGASLLLTDLGSSYGTFINGQRLVPNSPASLSRGDSFWLGSTAVTFTVR